VIAGELHGAQHQDTTAGGRDLEHLLEGDPVDPVGRGHHPRVGGEHPGHVGVDLAGVGVQHGGQRHGGGVRAAPAERGDLAVDRHALEAGHHRDPTGRQGLAQAVRLDLEDLGPGVVVVGDDADLAAGERGRVHAQLGQRHAQERHGDPLPGADEHVVLPGRLDAAHAVRQVDQVVGGLAHGAHHGHHVGSLASGAGDVIGHGADAVRVPDRGSSEFLDDHGISTTLMAPAAPSGHVREPARSNTPLAGG
jgi:hypothetical protein